MTKVIVVVQGGMVQEVFCRNKNVEIEVLDLDEQNLEELKEKEQKYGKIQKSKSYKNIL